jgi:hypothetical protein
MMTDSLGAAIYDYSLSFALKLTTCKSCMEVRYNLSRAQPHASSYLTSVDVWRMSRACEAAARQARHTSILVWARENGNNSYAGVILLPGGEEVFLAHLAAEYLHLLCITLGHWC